ncbi:GNAT family N-acetyltransferase [Clostridium amazonitimonense]|uniref:GNAT family N-acetyltransferase n=1 Tax=Clostridium amazonitimonense TaxID=1499689 RepID=UPI00068E5C04|nr:GNAT family N-acetyltransferase [Clostridium amazonitimonense]
MFNLEIFLEDIVVTDVNKEDLIYIQKWINSQKDIDESFNSKPLQFKEILERFLEYYISENEIFLKITKDNEIIGIFKGRVEFKKTNELIIWYFLIDKKHRDKGLGFKIISKLMEYVQKNMNITEFSSVAAEGNCQGIRFWRKLGFEPVRVAKNFFKVEEKQKDMIVLKRT